MHSLTLILQDNVAIAVWPIVAILILEILCHRHLLACVAPMLILQDDDVAFAVTVAIS